MPASYKIGIVAFFFSNMSLYTDKWRLLLTALKLPPCPWIQHHCMQQNEFVERFFINSNKQGLIGKDANDIDL